MAFLNALPTTANTPVTVGGEPIREVDSFIYLGSAVFIQFIVIPHGSFSFLGWYNDISCVTIFI